MMSERLLTALIRHTDEGCLSRDRARGNGPNLAAPFRSAMKLALTLIHKHRVHGHKGLWKR